MRTTDAHASPARVRVVQALLVAVALSMLSDAWAADPGVKCQTAKLKAATTLARKTLQCHMRATLDGSAVDPLCVAKPLSVLGKAFAKAEAIGGCLTSGDVAATEQLVQDEVATIVGSLRPTTTASLCGYRKVRAVATYAPKVLKVIVKQRKVSDEVAYAADLQQNLVRLRSALAGADAIGTDCLTSDDSGAVAAQVESFGGYVSAILWPATETSPPAGCTAIATAEYLDAYGQDPRFQATVTRASYLGFHSTLMNAMRCRNADGSVFYLATLPSASVPSTDKIFISSRPGDAPPGGTMLLKTIGKVTMVYFAEGAFRIDVTDPANPKFDVLDLDGQVVTSSRSGSSLPECIARGREELECLVALNSCAYCLPALVSCIIAAGPTGPGAAFCFAPYAGCLLLACGSSSLSLPCPGTLETPCKTRDCLKGHCTILAPSTMFCRADEPGTTACESCQKCEDGECVACGSGCETCENGSCVSGCPQCQRCENGTCVALASKGAVPVSAKASEATWPPEGCTMATECFTCGSCLSPGWVGGCGLWAQEGLSYYNCSGQFLHFCEGEYFVVQLCGGQCGVSPECSPEYAKEAAWATQAEVCSQPPWNLPPAPGPLAPGQVISFLTQAEQDAACCAPPP